MHQDIPGVSLLRIRFPLHACALQGGEGDQETRERREAVRENEISVWETACFIQFSPEESEVRVFNEMIRSPALFAATITEVARRRSEATRRAALSSMWLQEERVRLTITTQCFSRQEGNSTARDSLN